MKFLYLFLAVLAFSGSAKAKEWLEYENSSLIQDEYFDGDSFNVRVQTGYTYVFRLYGVDCAETDTRYPDRLEAQAKEFGIEAGDVVKWGEAAKKFTEDFLRKPFTVFTLKEKAGGQSKKNRYYAIIVNEDGERLDEALIEAGLGRAYGVGAEWPRRTSRERFIRKLHSIESKAKRGDVGVWENSTK